MHLTVVLFILGLVLSCTTHYTIHIRSKMPPLYRQYTINAYHLFKSNWLIRTTHLKWVYGIKCICWKSLNDTNLYQIYMEQKYGPLTHKQNGTLNLVQSSLLPLPNWMHLKLFFLLLNRINSMKRMKKSTYGIKFIGILIKFKCGPFYFHFHFHFHIYFRFWSNHYRFLFQCVSFE